MFFLYCAQDPPTLKVFLLSFFFFFPGTGTVNAVGANISSKPTQNMLSRGSSWMPSRFGTSENNIFMGTRNKHPYCNISVFKSVSVFKCYKEHTAEWLFLSTWNFFYLPPRPKKNTLFSTDSLQVNYWVAKLIRRQAYRLLFWTMKSVDENEAAFFSPRRSSERNKIVLITQSNLLLSQGLLVLKKTHAFLFEFVG